jgi:hypothetical protein
VSERCEALREEFADELVDIIRDLAEEDETAGPPTMSLVDTLAQLEKEGKIEKGWDIDTTDLNGKITTAVTGTFRRTLTFQSSGRGEAAAERNMASLAADLADYCELPGFLVR